MVKAGGKRPLQVMAEPGETPERTRAKLATDPAVTSAMLADAFGKRFVGELDLTELVGVTAEAAALVRKGDLSGPEAMLVAQASALNVMFTELARRGAMNMGEHIEATERYIRLALKAQAQCRATLETLAAIKSPPVVFAKQANIAAGPQQVNNGTNPPAGATARAGNAESVPNGLLEANGGSGERWEFGASGAASGGDKAVAAVGAVDGPAHG